MLKNNEKTSKSCHQLSRRYGADLKLKNAHDITKKKEKKVKCICETKNNSGGGVKLNNLCERENLLHPWWQLIPFSL